MLLFVAIRNDRAFLFLQINMGPYGTKLNSGQNHLFVFQNELTGAFQLGAVLVRAQETFRYAVA